ncbi:SPOR domain-containing protein [Streptomyces sp. NPDC088725]|uniref:SPOR domain-containing protein n=1 Tax=Streptomyces sp. NPDC088725 TaxID=3365873 RepID=UPI0037FBC848
MNDSKVLLPWLVIRQDDPDNHYRVGTYATRDEAEKLVSSLDRRGKTPLYSVECVRSTTP